MEHRNGRRVKLTLPVELWQGRHRLRDCRSSDFGHGGLCLTVEGTSLREGDLVTVKMTPGAAIGERPVERKAMVVYRYKDRLGLMWADVDSGFMAVLSAGETIAA